MRSEKRWNYKVTLFESFSYSLHFPREAPAAMTDFLFLL